MDPISAAALVALAGTVGGEAGRQMWQGLSALVRRPFSHRDPGDVAGAPGIGSGQEELAAFEAAPADPVRAQRLITMLEVRASMDAEFRTLLANWWDLARTGDTGGTVHNHVEGSQSGPVVLGRDFSNITFNIHPTATPTD